MPLVTMYCITQQMPENTDSQPVENQGLPGNVTYCKHYFKGISKVELQAKDGGKMLLFGMEWTKDAKECYLYLSVGIAKKHMVETEMLDTNELAVIEPIQVDESEVYPAPKELPSN